MNKDYLIETFQTLHKEGKATLDLKEAAVLSGSAYNKGGEFGYTDSFYSLRYTNPLRLGTMTETLSQAAIRWVGKIGDATVSSSSTGAWGEVVQQNLGNVDTRFWSLPMRTIATTVPIRSWIWEDIPNAYMSILGDILFELSQREAQSAAQNFDNNTLGTVIPVTGSANPVPYGNGFTLILNVASTTGVVVGQFVQVSGATNPVAWNGFYQVVSFVNNTSVTLFYPANPGAYVSGTVSMTLAGTSGYGGQAGLRGLDSYTSAPVTFSTGTAISSNPGFVWGASGDSSGADNSGRHSIVTVQQGGATPSNNVVYNDLLNVATSLPGQYWGLETTCWHATPQKINELRVLKDANNLPVLLDVGIPREGGAGVSFMGWPVIVNPFLSTKYPLYLMNSMMALSFVDHSEVQLELYEQSLPGTLTVFAQKRVCFSIKDPAAIVRLQVGS